MGRILLAQTTGTAEAATQAKYESLDRWIVQMRVRVDGLRSAGIFATTELCRHAKNTGGYVGLQFGDTGIYRMHIEDNLAGSATSVDLSLSALPANGNDIVLYWARTDASTAAWAVGTPDGTVIEQGTAGAFGAGLSTGANTGTIRVGANSRFAPNIDSVAILNAVRTGDARFAKPLPTDADVVGLYYMAEGSGATTADSIAGGTALTLTGNTWQTPGAWDSAGGGGGGIAPGTRVLLNYYN